ncbi:polyketide synthase dehydratase domain-containing protein [Streptomyces albogriseolus]|uniref:polyketide synthase family protein n=1 Tax=Streptomyces albogriseolus TaxID=1887 RepID=UPI003F4A1F8D
MPAPGDPTLSGLAKRFLTADAGPGEQPEPDEQPVFLPSLRPRRDDWQVLLDSLGTLYTRGVAVDWERYDADRGRRRTELPTYAFQRASHWFRPSARPAATAETAPAPADGLSRTLLGERVISPLPTAQFAATVGAEAHPCLGDCVMDGLPVVNIGVYLETALEASRELYGAGPALVEDCLVLQSMVLDPGERAEVQLLVDESTAGPGRGAYRYFAARSGDHDDQGAPRWTLHAQGRVGPSSAATATEDLDALRARLTTEISGDDFHRGMWRRKLYLGPSAQWIEHIHTGEGEALARMRPARPEESGAYLLHPGLTDALFQTLFACLPPDSPPDATYMLVGIDRFLLNGPIGGGATHCRVRLLPSSDPATMLLAEVRLYDDRGRTLVEADGVCLRRAAREQLLRAEPQDEAITHRAMAERPATTAPAAAARAPRDPDAVRDLLARTVATALGSDRADLDVHEPLQNLGLDSLMALEVKETLAARLGVSLPLVIFLDGRSVDTLGTELLGLLGADDASEEPDTAGASRSEGGALPVLVPAPEARHEPFPLTDLQQAYLVGRSNAFELGNVSTYFFIEVDVEEVDLTRLSESLRLMGHDRPGGDAGGRRTPRLPLRQPDHQRAGRPLLVPGSR